MDIISSPLGPALDAGPLLLPLIPILAGLGVLALVVFAAVRDGRALQRQLDRIDPAPAPADDEADAQTDPA
ncbi:hypothetical protein [Nonomuraea sp. NPDC049695]|uniref:hypothetical protein n=1 Tax=Nonomuraea sp. NPDC049695 TaxID=3154734 RepID=UPI00341E4219